MFHRNMRFVEEEDGTTAIEYALLAGLVSVGIVTAATAVGTNLNLLYNAVAAGVAAAAS